MAKSYIGEMVTKLGLFGVAGWVLENALCGDRYSGVFGGHKVPFLPIYAANGLALSGVASYLSDWPIFGRGLAYATLGTAIEYAGCQIDRKLLAQRAGYSYSAADPLASASEGCVNFTRAALWGGFGLIAEKFT